jgi:drug/metabolite transporter (DMT)-like permease
MNLSMFLVGALVCLPSLFFSGPIITGSVTPLAILGLSHLGGVTAIGFLLQALAMRKLSALVATIIQSFMAILTVLWSAVLFKEPVTLWVIGGTIIFVIGILAVNIKGKAKA